MSPTAAQPKGKQNQKIKIQKNENNPSIFFQTFQRPVSYKYKYKYQQETMHQKNSVLHL